MKKFLVVLAIAGAGYLAWRKLTEADDKRDLWAEVTDEI